MRAFLSGVAAGYGIAVPVGAIAVLIIDTGARLGFPSGFAAGLGAATADLLYAGLAAAGGLAVAGAIAPVAPEVRLAGGLALLGVAAYRLLGLARTPGSSRDPRPPPGILGIFAGFLGLTLINPLTIVYFAALITGLSGDLLETGYAKAAFVAGAFVASLSWQSGLAAAGTFLGGWLPRGLRLTTGIVGNLVVVGLALRLLLGGTG